MDLVFWATLKYTQKLDLRTSLALSELLSIIFLYPLPPPKKTQAS